jgi:hypothetical protein
VTAAAEMRVDGTSSYIPEKQSCRAGETFSVQPAAILTTWATWSTVTKYDELDTQGGAPVSSFLPLRTTPDCELDIENKPEWGIDAGQAIWI